MRNRINLLFLYIVLLSVHTVYSAEKAIVPGAEWLDDRGIAINAHGGGILYDKGVYYWYGEHKAVDTSNATVGFNCYSSKDLTSWKFEGVALSVDQKDTLSEIASNCIMERPKVIYNAATKKYVMWFHLELRGKGYSAARAAVAVSDKATGPFTYLYSMRSNAGKYPLNMTEAQKNAPEKVADFPKSFTPEATKAVVDGLFVRRDLAGGQMARDMTLFVDDDQKAYHIYASEENRTLQIAELSKDYLSYSGRYVRILPAKHNEGPSIFKRKGKYYLITSGCTGWDPNAARMAVADSLFGTWTELGNPCVGEDANKTFHSQSTYIQQVVGKKDLYIFMADRWKPERPIDARYIWLPILFDKDTPRLKWFDSWKLSDF